MADPSAIPLSLADIGLDMFDPEAIARPHEFYARLREEAPIVWSDQTEAWVLTRYDDVSRVLRDHERFSSVRRQGERAIRGQVVEQVAPVGTKQMLGADRPDHTRLRKLLSLDFVPRKISPWQPRIEEICAETLHSASKTAEFDVVRGIAEPLPVTIIAELLGIPSALGRQFKAWSDAAIEPLPPTADHETVQTRNSHIAKFRAYLQARIDERHENPSDDLIGRLVAAHEDDGRLTDAEVLAAVNLLLLAGNETTTNLISNATLALAKFPERQKELREHPELLDGAVEEFLRYDGSVQYTSRVLMAPAEFQGRMLDAGESVVVVLASANRDDRVFDNPDMLDFHRPKHKHLGFGDWIHICLGQFLARIETRAALKAILEEYDDFELAIPETDIPYRPSFNLRGPRFLPIRERS
jgi:cytochrome P450